MTMVNSLAPKDFFAVLFVQHAEKKVQLRNAGAENGLRIMLCSRLSGCAEEAQDARELQVMCRQC
jgi:hypothetical protein